MAKRLTSLEGRRYNKSKSSCINPAIFQILNERRIKPQNLRFTHNLIRNRPAQSAMRLAPSQPTAPSVEQMNSPRHKGLFGPSQTLTPPG